MEQKLINWMKQRIPDAGCAQTSQQNIVLGIGDDGAIVASSDAKQVHVADAIVDRVHFDLKTHSPRLIGRKALAVNLSDIAAMGAIAETALVTLVLPKAMSFETAQDLFEGIVELAVEFDVAIIGGDTVRHGGPLMINVAATGRIDPASRCPNGWRMNSANVGDLILVSGPLGGSILGNHLEFQPQLSLANAIQQRVSVSSATDISDSLSVDLSHVLNQSGVGAELELGKIPIHNDAVTLSGTSEITAIQHAISDGEDFQLLITMPNESWNALDKDDSFAFELHPIGHIVDGNVGMIIDKATGAAISVAGFEH